MAEQGAPRSSLDDESAPLLNEETALASTEPSWLQSLSTHTTKPLTAMSRALLMIALLLLLISATFVGLFAGAQHKLSERLDSPVSLTTTVFQTTTEVRTKTEIQMSTSVSTITQVSTTTTVVTRTASPLPGPTADPRDQVCMSSDCILLSASILSNLDMTVDPCEDFFQFANGGWVQGHPIPADKGLLTSFALLGLENERIIEHVLTKRPLIPPTVPDAQILTKLQTLYASCMDEEGLDARSVDPFDKMVVKLRQLLNGRVGENVAGMPFDGKQTVTKESPPNGLTAALAWLHSRGIKALFSFDIEGDSGVDPDLMTLWFSQPELGLPSKEYYEESDILDVYTSVLSSIFLTVTDVNNRRQTGKPHTRQHQTMDPKWPWPWPKPPPCECDGKDPPDDKDERKEKKREAENMAKAVVHFERALARAGADLAVLLQDPIATYNPVPIANLTATLPSISFPTYFSSFAPRSFPSQVIITYPAYPVTLARILAYTSPRIIEHYFIARLALELGPNLGKDTEIWGAVRSLEEVLRGLKKGAVSDRSEYCLKQVEAGLGFAAGRFFVEKTFRGDSRKKATEVIQAVINAFQSRLPELEWMDSNSSKAAAEKASSIRVKVGFPLSPNTSDAWSIERYYSSVVIHEQTFFENMVNARVHDQVIMWSKLGKRRDKEEWEMIPSEVNAYFQPPANEIVFPAGILRPPFFSQDWPSYLSYGSFGSVASHELTHAFDNAGRLYNQQGKLEEWWTNSTSERFNKHAQCISRQYSDYWIDDGKGGRVFVNGNLTSGENIGDAGIALSYRAWQAQFNQSFSMGTEYRLPGLNFTREQLFFLSYARTWSASVKPATALQRVRTDPHSPPKFRTNGPLSNLPEFSRAFNCAVGSPMNPPRETQCRLW